MKNNQHRKAHAADHKISEGLQHTLSRIAVRNTRNTSHPVEVTRFDLQENDLCFLVKQS